MVFAARTVLAVGAHPDDIELGCGGTLCNAVMSGTRVVAVYVTRGEISGRPKVRLREAREALAVLGVKEVHFGDFPDAQIPLSRKAVDFLEHFCIKNSVDIVLTHTVHDIHQDHRQVGWLSVSAFRNIPNILAYETPRVTAEFTPTYFVDISRSVERKGRALKCHVSQKARRYLTYESMVSLASFRGSQVGVPAAEAFEVVKYLERPFEDDIPGRTSTRTVEEG